MLGRHLSALFRAPATAFRTPLTVIVGVRRTLLSTPVADLYAESAVFLHVLAVASDRLGTECRSRDTLGSRTGTRCGSPAPSWLANTSRRPSHSRDRLANTLRMASSLPLFSLPFGNASSADQGHQRFLPQRLVGHPEDSAEDQVPGEARENHDWLPSTLLTWPRLHNKKKAQSSPPPRKVPECAFSLWLCGSANQDRPGIVLSSAPIDSPDNRVVAR